MSSNNYIFLNQNKTVVASVAASQPLTGPQIYAPNTIYTFANAGNITVTFPTAANLVAAHRNYFGIAAVGDIFRISLINVGATALIAAISTGGTLQGPNAAGQPAANGNGNSLACVILLTNVTAGAEAYDLYFSPGL